MSYKSFEITTDSAVEPVSTADVKSQLRIDSSAEDTLIDGYTKSARHTLERLMRRAFITQTITLKYDSFPADIRLPRPPAIAVTSIQYVDADGATQTLAPSTYVVDTSIQPASIQPAYGESYPSTRTQANAVTIVYTAGYGATGADVPEPILLAIKLLVGSFFENREATGVLNVRELPLGLQMLVASYEMPEVF